MLVRWQSYKYSANARCGPENLIFIASISCKAFVDTIVFFSSNEKSISGLVAL